MKKLLITAALFCLINSLVYSSEKIDLTAIQSPIIFKGDSVTAYRDPAVLFADGKFHLWFTLVEIEPDGKIFSYTAQSESSDFVNWSAPKKITPRNQNLNTCSPGNVVQFSNEWILCLQTYPRPNYYFKDHPRYGDNTARVFKMRSDDLQKWSEPEILLVKGADVLVEDMGRMIDPYLIEDKDEPGKWWCFYKQNGVSMSYSYDLKSWTYFGRTDAGENVCVFVEDNNYVLFHSPQNGIGIKRSKDLQTWEENGELITLGLKNWEWAKGRLTAGVVIDCRDVAGIEKYLLFFHGSGPEPENKMFDNYSSIGLAWSENLINWNWPGKND